PGLVAHAALRAPAEVRHRPAVVLEKKKPQRSPRSPRSPSISVSAFFAFSAVFSSYVTIRSVEAYEAAPGRDLHRLGAARDAELLEQMTQVGFDRSLADAELIRDFLVGLAVGHQAQRRQLAWG